MKRYLSLIVAGAMFVVIVLVLILRAHSIQKTSKNHKITIPVVVSSVSQMSIPNEVQAVGTLQPKRQVSIAPQIAGQVTKVAYDPGRFVQANALLIQLDDRIYASKLRSAESALHLAKMDYQRLQKLSKSGATSRQALDQSRAAYQQAAAAVSTNETYLSQASIKAPFAGFVGPKLVSMGDYVQKGQQLTTLTDRSELRVDYHLSERYLAHIKLGQAIMIDVPTQKHLIVKGKVTYISPVVDELTHSIALEATIPNENNRLTPGMFVRIKQTLHFRPHAITVPQSSIVPSISGPKIYVVNKDKTVTLTRIKTGEAVNNQVEVLSGLTPADRVVIAGQQRLQDGAAIREVSS